ncbi:MAG: hypothetical protein JEZ06_20175 [Anaerolineaceae bacterium]|nr:hypothetical protein [Anaerolineaceae bacterium]
MSTSKKQLLGFFLAIIVLIAIGLAITFLARGKASPDALAEIPVELQPEMLSDDGIGMGEGEFEEFEEFEELEAPVEKENVIVSLVEVADGSVVSKAAFYLTENLFETSILVNGQQEGIEIIKDGTYKYVELIFTESMQTNDLSVSFVRDGNELAVCRVLVTDSINLSGDCNW